MKEKVFALVDCNSFYCSCERLFKPSLKNKPVIVLSNNDGCAIARTQEAKDLGIKMGDPFFKIRDYCKKSDIHVFSSNFALYTNISDRVMKTLARFAVTIEVYSVDEAWLDITGVTDDYTAYGKKIEQAILREVGIPVGVGIAPTKTMAKLANHLAKKSIKANGVVNLMEKQFVSVALKRVAVGDVWGIGSRSAEKLRAINIRTAYDFVNFKNDKLIQKILTKPGLQRKQELQGIRCFELEVDIQDKRSIGCSRSFSIGVYAKNEMKEAIANYITHATQKLRKQKGLCSRVSVYMRTSPFKDTNQYSRMETALLASPSSNTCELIEVAWAIVEIIFKQGYEYKKAGIELHGLIGTSEFQLSFPSFSNHISSGELMKVMDNVNVKNGDMCLKSLACGTSMGAWKMLREHKSPSYTTNFKHVQNVK